MNWKDRLPSGKPLVTIDPPLEPGDHSAISEDLADSLGLPSNYEIQDQIREYISFRDPALLARLTFDSESGQFCCCGSNEDLTKVSEYLEAMFTEL
jgi:hypothetical protein